jgi:hypothetical protein
MPANGSAGTMTICRTLKLSPSRLDKCYPRGRTFAAVDAPITSSSDLSAILGAPLSVNVGQLAVSREIAVLCERCQKLEATVHITSVVVDSDSTIHHDFCESCAIDPAGGALPPRVLQKQSGWTAAGTSYEAPRPPSPEEPQK